jgi:hypothetical protein
MNVTVSFLEKILMATSGEIIYNSSQCSKWGSSKPYSHRAQQFKNPTYCDITGVIQIPTHTPSSTITPDTSSLCFVTGTCSYHTTNGNMKSWQSIEKSCVDEWIRYDE